MHTKINGDVKLREFDKEYQIKFSVNRINCSDLCMGLFVLKEGLADSINIQFDNYLIILKISSGKYSSFEKLNNIQKVFKGNISINELEYFIYYLLKLYRDGIAEAEHIDISFASSDNVEVMLTVSCSDYFQYSEDQITNMLK